MRTFDEAFEKVIQGRKYDVLTGRTPNFREIFQNAVYGFIDKYIMPLLRRLRFNAPGDMGGAAKGTLRNIFIVAAVLLVAAAAFFIIRHIKRRGRGTDKSTREIIEALRSSLITYENLLQEAAAFAEKGLLRDAVRYEYIALLWVLNTRGVLYLTDYKTNNRIKNEVKTNAPQIFNSFSNVVNIFNLAWFGHKSISREAYDDNRALIMGLI